MVKKEVLLKSREVAHILDCSPDDVIQLARQGTLRAVKMGRFWKFRQDDVLAYKRKADQGTRGVARRTRTTGGVGL